MFVIVLLVIILGAMWARASLLIGGMSVYGYWSVGRDSESQSCPELSQTKVPLVLIPGLKGSVLMNNKTNETHYVTPKQSLHGNWNLNLELPMKWNNNKQEKDDLEVVFTVNHRLCD